MRKSKNITRRVLALGLAMGLTAALAGPAVAQAADKAADTPADAAPEWQKRTDQRFEKLTPGQPLRVRNPFGSVFARFGGYENESEILSTAQRIDKDLPELEVTFQRDDLGALEVRVARTSANGQSAPTDRGRDRIDLVFFVPLGTPFDVETLDGGVEMKGVKSDVRIRTDSGDIRLRSIQGAIRAETNRGEIGVSLAGESTGKEQVFQSVTGDIEIYAWEDSNLEARLATSGDLTTDFSLEIDFRKFEEPSKHGRAVLGSGGPVLRMTSKRGNLRLLRLIRDFLPDRGKSGSK